MLTVRGAAPRGSWRRHPAENLRRLVAPGQCDGVPLRSSLARSLVLVACLTASACDETPARGFERFYEALAEGAGEEAVSRLTTRAQAQLAAAAAPRGLTPAQALAVTFPKSTLKAIAVVEGGSGDIDDDGDDDGDGDGEGDRAVLEVTDALGKKERVLMRKEDGRWKVDFEAGGS